jgi:hypothetical protein
MVAFSATHLAVLIGAKRIIYVGFESKSKRHFHGNEPYYTRFYKHLEQTIKRFPKHKGHAEIMIKSYYPQENDRTTAKMRADYARHLKKYELLFDRLKQLNIKPYTTTKESIIYEAGGSLW